MKKAIHKSQWYPVFEIHEIGDPLERVVEISDELLAEYKQAMKAFRQIHEKIDLLVQEYETGKKIET